MMRRLLQPKFYIPFLGIFLLILSFCFYWLLLRPPSETPEAKVLLIKKGLSLRSIASMLEQEGIIRNRNFFVAATFLLGKRGVIKAGEYDFHTGMSPLHVLNTLVKGQVKRHLITVVEGYTLSQIAQLLDDLNIVDRRAFLQKATSPVFIESLRLFPGRDGTGSRIEASLEGYLYPETYNFTRDMDPEEVIRVMVNQFKKVVGSDLAEKAPQLGITQREAVILASIIEKETSLPQEKPLISAVFQNRLRKKIPLHSDPTVIYGIKNFDGNLTKEHLLTPNPYNTYLIGGLPPTPICNPGRDSLLAALNPAAVPYLYFVSRNDGSHHFSIDIEEHQRAVWKYQKSARR
jgi:UPF0755 protein